MDFQRFNGLHWSRTIPETYAAFAKSAAVLEATPMTEEATCGRSGGSAVRGEVSLAFRDGFRVS